MKKLIILFSFLLFINCGDDTINNDCFSNVNISGTINLSNPEFINLQVPLGFSFTSLAGRSLLIINSTSSFKAFDLECPERDCSSNMEYDGLKLICPCSGKEYNSLNGSAIGNPEDCFALEYNVVESSSSTLQISN